MRISYRGGDDFLRRVNLINDLCICVSVYKIMFVHFMCVCVCVCVHLHACN